MIRSQYSDEVLQALAYLRVHAAVDARASVKKAFDALDNAGVFADLDEQVDYASAEEILAEAAAQEQVKSHRGIRPEEALQVLHNTWQRPGRTGRRDPLAPAPELRHTHVFNTPHSDELCAGDPDCVLTYGEYRAYDFEAGPQKVVRPGDHIHHGCGLDCNR